MNPRKAGWRPALTAVIGNVVVLGLVYLVCRGSGARDLCAVGLSLVGAGLVLFSFCAFNECGMSQQRTHNVGMPGFSQAYILEQRSTPVHQAKAAPILRTNQFPAFTLAMGLPIVLLGAILWLIGR